MIKSGSIKKRVVIGIAVALAVYWGLSIFGAIAAMRIPRLPLINTPDSVGLAYEDIAFTSRGDSVLLKGWYVPGERNFIITIVHGGYQNRVDDNVGTLELARDLAARGYALLLFDLRGRGESEGRGVTLSNIDEDLGGAVDFLRARGYSRESIGIIGFCSGAASSCIFASQEHIGALVLDGCFASIHGMVVRQAASKRIPQFLVDFFSAGVLLMAKIIYGYEVVNPIDVVTTVNCPILFIHEEYDDLISLEETYQLLEVSNSRNNELWEVSDAEHSQAYRTYPAEYVEKIDEFFTTGTDRFSSESR